MSLIYQIRSCADMVLEVGMKNVEGIWKYWLEVAEQ